MSDADGRPLLQRAVIFLVVLCVSLPTLPIAAIVLSPVLPSIVGNAMFFWPQVILFPNGFMSMEIGGSEAFLMDSAIYGAIIFWILIAGLFGKVFQKSPRKTAAWLALPVALVVAVALHVLLYAFGYTAYIDGP